MKLQFTLTLLLGLSAYADSNSEKFKGDQALQDGFSSKAWTFYKNSYSIAQNAEKPALLRRLEATAVKANKVEETHTLFSEFLKSKPAQNIEISQLANTYLAKCSLELQLRKFKNAAKTCELILAKPDQLPESTLKTALDFAVYSLANAKELKKASELIEKHLKSFADVARAELQNARLKILLGEYINALTILDKYKESKDSLPSFLRLWAYLKAGETKRAMEIFDSVILTLEQSPDPIFTGVLIKLAETISLENIDKSITILNKATSLEKNEDENAYIILKQAELLIKHSKNAEAILSLETFNQKYPKSNKSTQVKSELAKLYKLTGKTENFTKAETYLSEILNSQSDKVIQYDALTNRGITRIKLQKFKEATNDFIQASKLIKAAKLKPEHYSYAIYMAALSRYLEAQISKTQSTYLEAAQLFKTVIDTNTGFAEQAFTMHAVALRKAAKWPEAVDVLEAMLTRFPKNREAHYLLALSRFKAGNVIEGIKTMHSFIKKYPKDSKAPFAFVEALEAAVYLLEAKQGLIQSLEIIENFQKLSAQNKDFERISPIMLHLKSILLWKQKRAGDAKLNWQSFIKNYPDHFLALEAKLWLAFLETQKKPADLNQALSYYTQAIENNEKAALYGFTMWQYAKVLQRKGKHSLALESLEKSKAFFTERTDAANRQQMLSAVLFSTGEVLTSQGNYEFAIKSFEQAQALSTDENRKFSMIGRVGDCYFSLAKRLANTEENRGDFTLLMNMAIEKYKQINLKKNLPLTLREQALYKLAKCHETIGLSGPREPQNAELAKALEYYWELFFNHKDAMKKGLKSDPYYFCRTGYDLARLQLMFKDADVRSAVNTYKILAETKLPGTKEAGILARQLTKVLKSEK
ncbi:MAG: tetratricopeptide repeat protein [Lentisphaeraceae bacterium]|nr:tetratricopeptide repeat protein [Lentisphaeraceae bacterium]